MKGWELVQGLASRIIAEDPREFAREILEKAAACLGARRAALFHHHEHGLGLFASRSLDQRVIDLVDWLWETRHASLEAGKPFLASAERAAAQAEVQAVLSSGATAVMALPIRTHERLAGLLYVDGRITLSSDVVDGARALAEISAAALRAPIPPIVPADRAPFADTRPPSEEVLRDQLLQVLEENEWNIARVARLMGLSRVTIYSRLARYDLERKKVPKGTAALGQLTRLAVGPSAAGTKAR